MKKLLCVLLTICIIFAMSACGSTSPEPTPSLPESVALGEYYCVRFETGSDVQTSSLDSFINIVDDTNGYRYTGGDYINFKYSYDQGKITINTAYAETIEGTYDGTVILLDTGDTVQEYDSSYEAKPVPATKWTAVSVTDQTSGEILDLPSPTFDVRIVLWQSGTGSINISRNEETISNGFKWSQHGNAVILEYADGSSDACLYEGGYFYLIDDPLLFVFDVA